MASDPKQEPKTASPLVDLSLWSRFAAAKGQEEYVQCWLEIQCAIIPGATQGLVVFADETRENFIPVTSWPEIGGDPERLAEISDRVIEERCGLLVELPTTETAAGQHAPSYGIAYPILLGDQLYGVVSLEVQASTEVQLQYSMEQLQWGVSWMELFFRRQESKEDRDALARLEAAVSLLAGILSEQSFEGACMAFVTDLATQLHCDRVSLAFIKKKHARIQAISHSSQVSDRMNLVRSIGLAMDEAIVQRKEVVYPPPTDKDTVIVREHEQLAEQQGAGSILTMPFYGKETFYGALTLERPQGQRFSEEEVRFCRSVAALIFPVLDIRRKESRSLFLKIADAIRQQFENLLGPGHLKSKVAVCLLILIIGFFSVKMADFKISADAVLEGAVRRAVVAPFDGYIKEAEFRAGDLVDAQTRLCVLDDRELRLQRLNWLSKRNQYQRQYQEAMAAHQRAESKIIKAQLEQATARLDLAESMLARTRIQSPIAGVIINGDLSQRLGGSVGKGEVLFEVAPLDAYRVILQVDERHIADVAVGQHGRMVLSSLPQEQFDFVVEKVTPISTATEGRNYFRVEATLDRISKQLRPGMEGVGKILVDRRKLIWIWTRDLREWGRLWVWSWWP